jgi:hypothetical protein
MKIKALKDFITISKKWISIGLTVMLITSCATITTSSLSSANGGQISSSVMSSVDQVSIIAVEVDTLPIRVTYTPVEVVSTQGGILRVVYSDYSVRYISMNDSMIDLTRFDTSKIGTSNITIKYQELGVELFTAYTVNIVEFKIEPINLSIDIISSDVLLGESFNLNYIIEPLNANYDKVAWNSSNQLIASVDQNGFVNPKNVGEVFISVTIDGVLSASSRLNIVPSTLLTNNNQNDNVSNDEENNQVIIDRTDWIAISSVAELNNVLSDLNLKYYLTNNIDFSGVSLTNGSNFAPIASIGNPFKGTFDGNGFSIKNLIMDYPNQDYVGLFSTVDSDHAEIYDLSIENANIKGKENVGALSGVIWAFNNQVLSNIDGSIRNINVLNSNISGINNVGGLSGNIDLVVIANSEIANTIIYGLIRETGESQHFGGMIGYGTRAKIISSKISNINIDTVSSFVGGLVGRYLDSFVENSYSTGVVKGSDSVGGLVGLMSSDSSILNSFSSSETIGGVAVGGLVGELVNSKIINSYSIGIVNGGSKTGGLIGDLNGLIIKIEITNSYSNSLVNVTSDNDSSGRFIGFKSIDGENENAIVSSYFNIESTFNGGTANETFNSYGKTLTQLRNIVTYVGWNFENIWSIDSSLNSGLPFLTWQIIA